MPLGFYYSPPICTTQPFVTRELAKENWNGSPLARVAMYLEYMRLQLTELLTKYARSLESGFDGLHHQEKYDGNRS